MPVDFDEEDISDPTAAEEIQQVFEAEQETVPADEDVDAQMSEVEKRLEMAQYYRLLLNESLFDSPSSPDVAERVENEIREFVRSRMSVLVGVGTEQPKQVQLMSKEEADLLRQLANPEVVRVMKELAAKLLKKPAIMDFKPKPVEEVKVAPKVMKEPTLRKVPRIGVKPSAQAARQAESNVITISGDQPIPKAKPGQRQKKVFRTITTEDGKVIKQDVTPPAQPIGVQPLPTPRTRDQIEMASAQAAAAGARMAENVLDQNLRGKG